MTDRLNLLDGNNTTAIVLLPSAERTTDPIIETPQLNNNRTGVQIITDITAIAGGSITVTIKALDIASGKFYTLLGSIALTAIGTYLLTLEPGNTEKVNEGRAGYLPRVWAVTVTHADASAITYSVGANLVD